MEHISGIRLRADQRQFRIAFTATGCAAGESIQDQYRLAEPTADGALPAPNEAWAMPRWTPADISGLLAVSVNAVRNHIRSIYEKLHVHSASEAVSKAIRKGLI